MWMKERIGLIIGFIENLELNSKCKDYALTDMQTSEVATKLPTSSQSLTDVASRCLVADSNYAYSPPLVPLTVPGLRYYLLTATSQSS
jgi:hypothetical protein